MKNLLTIVSQRTTRFVIIFLLLYACCTISHAQSKLWDKRFGGSELDDCYTSLATPDGGYLLGGPSASGIGGDKTQDSRGGDDYWVVKINAKGNKVWDKRYGGTNDDVLGVIVPTTDGGFLLGGSSDSPKSGDKSQPARGLSDYWIVKIDFRGHKLWDRRFGGDQHDKLLSMTPTPDGGFILAGASYSGVSGDKTEPSIGEDDFWIVKIDGNGNKLWDKRYGGNASDLLTEIVPTYDGGFLLAGRSSSSIGDDKSEAPRGEYDFWALKIDAVGNKEWDKTFGGELHDLPTDLIQTSDGGFLIGGETGSDIGGDVSEPSRGMPYEDMWVVKLDRYGRKVWDKRFGGSHADGLRAIEPTSDGNYLLGGWSYSPISGEKTETPREWGDFWIVKIDPNGNYIWDKTFGGDLYDAIYTMSPMPGGNFLLAGASQSDVSFDKTQSSRGFYDMWIVKFKPTPTFSLFPKDHVVICDPICPVIDLDIQAKLFKGVASFSFRITLPADKASFNRTGHNFNPRLRSGVTFKRESANTMLVTWKHRKNISLADQASIVRASIKILDPSTDFQACISNFKAFNARGKNIVTSSACGNISFSNAAAGRVAQVNVNESASTEDAFTDITVFPNPGTDVFNLKIPHAGNYQITLSDARGRTLTKLNVSAKQNHHVEKIDLQGQPSGLYMVNVTDGKRTTVAKILKR
jgi:hypothetical protein